MRKKNVLLMLIVLLISIHQFTHAQEELELLGETVLWGECYDIEAMGNFIYVASGNGGLKVIDISDPDNLQEVGHTNDIIKLTDICISGDYIFGVSGYDLITIDISDPENPYVAATQTDRYAKRIVIQQHTMILVNSIGIEFWDISNPLEAEYQSFTEFDFPNDWNGDLIPVSDNLAYLIRRSVGIEVIDFSDRTAPVVVDTLYSGHYVRTMNKDGNRLYADILVNEQQSLHILDISTPLDPEVISNVNMDVPGYFPSNVTKGNGYLYYVSGERVVTDNGIYIVDITDEQNPVHAGFFQDNYFKSDALVIGDYLYTALKYYGLKSYDLDNPQAPVELDWIGLNRTIDDFEAYDNTVIYTTVQGDGWYSGDVGLISVLNTLSPENIQSLSTKLGESNLTQVKRSNNYVFVNQHRDEGISVYDVADPENIEMICTIEDGNYIRSLYAYQNLLIYSIDREDDNIGTVIRDVSNPLQSVELATLQNHIVAFKYPYLFVHQSIDTYTSEIKLLNISDPSSPEEMSTVCSGEGYTRYIRKFLVAGDYFIVDGYEGNDETYDFYEVIDISDPVNPAMLEREYQASFEYTYTAVGTNLIGYTEDHSLVIYDISDPSNLELTHIWDWDLSDQIYKPYHYGKVEVAEGKIYFAGKERMAILDGIEIFGRVDPGKNDFFVPKEFKIISAYPNPFNPTLNVGVSLPQTSELKVQVYNINGQLVQTLTDGRYSAGDHNLIFNGNGLSSGVYFINAVVPGESSLTRKVTLMK